MTAAPLADQIRCVERELALRRNVYAKRVRSGYMPEADAQRELEQMRAVLETLHEVGTLRAGLRDAKLDVMEVTAAADTLKAQAEDADRLTNEALRRAAAAEERAAAALAEVARLQEQHR